VRDNSNFVFLPENDGRGRKCETGRCHGEAAMSVLAKDGGDVLALFTLSPQNFAVQPGIHISACRDKFFMHNPLLAKESDDHALEIALQQSGLLSPW